MRADLHTHTLCSDGALDPAALLALASERGVELLSITDHDTVRAYRQLSSPPSLTLLPGVEFSTTWERIGIHVLGLNIQPDSAAIHEATAFQQSAREQRAEKIAARLEKAGARNILEQARVAAGEAAPGRVHFAHALIASGFCASHEQAFAKYLGSGKMGDVREGWASLAQVIDWIRAAGGVAVLAHPQHYALTRSKLLRLLDDFQQHGGQGIEVLSGSQAPEVTARHAELAVQRKLLASMGSDFHTPETHWCRPGMHAALPRACTPVWSVF